MLSKKEKLLPGNVVIYHSPEGDMYCQLDTQDIYNIATGYMDNDMVHSPVPITPDILEVILVNRGKFYYYNYGTNWVIIVFLDDYYNAARVELGKGFSCVVETLHQLQNIASVVYNTELDVSQLLKSHQVNHQ